MNNADWDHEKLLKLIELYRQKPELWDSNNKFYHCKNKKHESWLEITKNFDTDVDCIKKKMNSLLSSFRREKARGLRVNGIGQGDYESSWFAFKSFSFLLDKRRASRNNGEYQDTTDVHYTDVADEMSTDGDDTELKPDINYPTVQIHESPYILPFSDLCSSPKLKRNRVDRHPVRAGPNVNGHRDGSEAYGEYVGMKLKAYSKRTQAIVQHLISNVLFEADMGKYDGDDMSYYHSIPCTPTVHDYSPYPSPNPDQTTNRNVSPCESPTQSPSVASLKVEAEDTSVG